MTVLRNSTLVVALGMVLVGGSMLLGSLVLLGGCQGADGGGERELFGNGLLDNSRVVARVNGEPITEGMVELRLNEMQPSERSRYSDDAGKRLLVHRMVEEMLHAREAEALKLDQDPIVAQVLIAQYRQAMDRSHRNELAKGLEPTVDQVRDFYERNRDRYVKLGTMEAWHIETSTRDRAMTAYRDITERHRDFVDVCRDYSENKDTAIKSGKLGWFNPGGFIPGIKNSKAFSEAVWELDMGVNEPIEVDGAWHVVSVISRNPAGLHSLDEVYERVAQDVMPELIQAAVVDWTTTAKENAELEYFEEFRPGLGKTPRQLLDRALAQNDPKDQANTLKLLIEDYPNDELTDDAMFLAGNLHLDTWGDQRQASFYFVALLRKFPNSEFAADTEYILKNMGKPGFTQPQSIEDLRQK